MRTVAKADETGAGDVGVLGSLQQSVATADASTTARASMSASILVAASRRTVIAMLWRGAFPYSRRKHLHHSAEWLSRRSNCSAGNRSRVATIGVILAAQYRCNEEIPVCRLHYRGPRPLLILLRSADSSSCECRAILSRSPCDVAMEGVQECLPLEEQPSVLGLQSR